MLNPQQLYLLATGFVPSVLYPFNHEEVAKKNYHVPWVLKQCIFVSQSGTGNYLICNIKDFLFLTSGLHAENWINLLVFTLGLYSNILSCWFLHLLARNYFMQHQLHMGGHRGLNWLFGGQFSQGVNLKDKNMKCERSILAPSKSKLEKCTLHFFIGWGQTTFFFIEAFDAWPNAGLSKKIANLRIYYCQ